MQEGLITPVKAPEFAPRLEGISSLSPSHSQSQNPYVSLSHPITPLQLSTGKCCGNNGTYATSFFRQWYLLMIRTILCLRRDRSLALSRFIIHITIALLVGILYFNIGNDASMIFNNFRYIFMSIMFLMFTAFCTMTIICKLIGQCLLI